MGGWVGGDQKGLSIFLKIDYSNKQDVLIPNLALQILHGFYIKSYGKIKFEILRSISVAEISLKMMVIKDLSSRRKLRKVKKKLSKKSDFRFKNMKKTESSKVTLKVV